MQYEAFIESVRQESGLDTAETASGLVDACLETLGESLEPSERTALADQLPKTLQEPLFRREFMMRPHLEDFYHAVEARTEIGYPAAVKGTRAVMAVLAQAVTPEKLERAKGSLPPDYEELFRTDLSDPLSPTVDALSRAGEGSSAGG